MSDFAASPYDGVVDRSTRDQLRHVLITVPLTLHYLGAERYGLWATLSSIIALASFADLGLSNGLLNALASTHGLDDHEAEGA